MNYRTSMNVLKTVQMEFKKKRLSLACNIHKFSVPLMLCALISYSGMYSLKSIPNENEVNGHAASTLESFELYKA